MKQKESGAKKANKDILSKLMYILTPQQKSYGVVRVVCCLHDGWFCYFLLTLDTHIDSPMESIRMPKMNVSTARMT